MESLTRAHLLAANTVMELPLLILPHVVPFRLWELHHIRLVLTIASAQRRGQAASLGILNARSSPAESQREWVAHANLSS